MEKKKISIEGISYIAQFITNIVVITLFAMAKDRYVMGIVLLWCFTMVVIQLIESIIISRRYFNYKEIRYELITIKKENMELVEELKSLSDSLKKESK